MAFHLPATLHMYWSLCRAVRVSKTSGRFQDKNVKK